MELRRSYHCDGFEINSERDIKSVFQIGSEFTDHDEKSSELLEKFWKACNKI